MTLNRLNAAMLNLNRIGNSYETEIETENCFGFALLPFVCMQPPIRLPSTQIVSPSIPFVLYIQHSKSGSISIAIAKLLLNLFDAAAGVRARQEQEHSTKRERRKEVGSVAGWLAGAVSSAIPQSQSQM